ncbi:MAG TPA: methyltransferase domain-containing protein [Gaiellaceae bacterium]|jgi:ubiquinone/menaquinone biosynthesis C-methylase UbiE|nr:methyltransferase domain-containing protein [Gaiellaceae bacterium]
MSQKEHFDSLADRYDELRTAREPTPVHHLLVREGELAGKRVLDIGCGTGAHMAILAAHFGCEVAGLDASEGMLAQARAKLPEADLRLGPAEQLPFADASFDAALMVMVAHHLDRPRAFAEARRVLEPAGRLLILTSNPDAFPRFWMAGLFPSYAAVERARFPSFEALESELRSAGFRHVRRIDHRVPRRFSREEALAKLRGRYASTFELLGDREYAAGVERAARELPDEVEYMLELIVVVAST